VNTSLLVVEENDTIRSVLRDWLETVLPGLEVIEAANHEETIALVRAREPRVILIGISSPGTDGIKAIRRIKTAVPLVEIVALAMNSYTIYHDEVRAAGASAYVSMWKMHTELLLILKRLLGPMNERKTVVCIEDEPDMIKLIKFAFERNGFKLIGAMGGGEGLRTVRRIKPDLVLLDLMMAEVDGWQVYQQMKADDELKNIPIIIVTVIEPDSVQVRSLQVHDYIRKPFIPRELVRRANAALDVETQHK